MKHYSKEKELREKFWQEIFGSIDKACYEEGLHIDGMKELFMRVRKLIDKKNVKK